MSSKLEKVVGLHIGKLKLKNVVHFNNAEVDFSRPGMTTIRGLNLHARSKSQTNGAGKSLLASSICSVFQFGPPMASARRGQRWHLQATPSAVIEQELTKNGHTYRLVQATHGKGVKYSIYKNGEDLKIRTTPLAEQFITELHGYNNVEWFSTVYLDGRRVFPLQMGTDVERLAFIVDFFRLEESDRIRQMFNNMKSDFKEDVTKLGVVDADIVRVRRELKEIGWSKNKAKRRRFLKKKVVKVREQHRILTSKLESLNEIRAQSEIVGDLKSRLEAIDRPKLDISEIERQLKAYKLWLVYEAESAEYDKKFARLKAERNKLGSAEGLKKSKTLLTELRRLESEIGRLKVSHATLTRNQDEVESALEDLRVRYQKLKHLNSANLPKNRKARSNVLNDKIAQARAILKLVNLADKGHDHCPTCGSSINQKTIKGLGKRAKKEIEEAESEIEQLQQADELESVLEEGRKLREAKDEEAEIKIKATDKALRKARSKLVKVEEHLEKALAHESLNERTAELVRHKPVEPLLKKPSTSEKQLKKWATAHDLLLDTRTAYNKAVEKLASSTKGFPSLEEALRESRTIKQVREQQSAANDSLYSLTKELSTLDQKQSLYKSAALRLGDLEESKAKFSQSVQDLPVLDALIHAFSNKGLKMLLAKQIASRIEQNINLVAPRIFVESVKFRWRVEANKFAIEYSMRKGKDATPWADVRVLSGSESKQFILATVAALLPLLPADKRTNLMILDEMDANMSEETRRLFATDFLPYLRKLVPTLFVVTPDQRTPYPGRQLLVTKKNGVSSISWQPDVHELVISRSKKNVGRIRNHSH